MLRELIAAWIDFHAHPDKRRRDRLFDAASKLDAVLMSFVPEDVPMAEGSSPVGEELGDYGTGV